MKISKQDLLKKIEQLDQKIMGLWLNDNCDFNDDDIWEMFVVLLETRVEILNVCAQAQVPLTKEICLPEWLAKLTNVRKEIRLHELKKLATKKSQAEKYKLYESIAEIFGEKNK
jgi:hypothetical protein